MIELNDRYEMVIMGNYTKDTIESASGTRLVDGGGFNYGAHVGAMMGLKVAAVTRLAKADFHVVDALKRLGIAVFATATLDSTVLRLYYPTDNVDDRIITATSTAGAFTPDQIKDLHGKAFLVNASTRGEVPFEVLTAIKKKPDTQLVIDAQGFVRVIDGEGIFRFQNWPERDQILAIVDILKADIREAEILTGLTDMRQAARVLVDLGPKEVVITSGQGILVYDGNQFYKEPFHQKSVQGRSGRGDTCIAAFVAKRLSAPAKEATRWAAAITSMKMEREGPILRRLSELEAYLERMYPQLC